MKVHESKMAPSENAKYLGDLISSSGKEKQNLITRKEKGFGIVTEILSILEEVPLGKFKIQIALVLRQAMFLNGILFNSEAWHNVSEKDH